jgi:diaminohydroxyphosphoribosylaminopyrimidine deaminase/5-amino-6-(5-phosphoribosylamino)uracil reductase
VSLEAQLPSWSESSFEPWHAWWCSFPKDSLISAPPTPNPGEQLSDAAAAMLSLIYALQGTGSVSPNPLVGCVIRNKNGQFLAAGSHAKYGSHHAEIHAMSKLSIADLNNARVTVSLEPCSHYGKTPPCAEALIRANVSAVDILVKDPNPKVNGTGIQKLANAGIQTRLMTEYEPLAREVNEVFFHDQTNHEPFFGLKMATSVDGVFAFENSSRQWITNERSRIYGHYLRLRYDAILIGPKTALLDNPTLTVRSPYVAGRTPERIVIDKDRTLLPLLESLHVFKSEPNRTIYVTIDRNQESNHLLEKLQSIGVSVLKLPSDPVPSKESSISLHGLSSLLYKRGIKSILIEGGAGIWTSALESGLIKKIHQFIGPLKAQESHQEQARSFKIPKNSKIVSTSKFTLDEDQYLEGYLTN